MMMEIMIAMMKWLRVVVMMKVMIADGGDGQRNVDCGDEADGDGGDSNLDSVVDNNDGSDANGERKVDCGHEGDGDGNDGSDGSGVDINDSSDAIINMIVKLIVVMIEMEVDVIAMMMVVLMGMVLLILKIIVKLMVAMSKLGLLQVTFVNVMEVSKCI